MAARKSVGIVGARGYVGAELIKLLAAHPELELAFVSSRELAGRPVADTVPEYGGAARYGNLAPEAAAQAAEIIVLGLPNGYSTPYVEAIDRLELRRLVIDLSADHRFDPRWFYGLPELYRKRYARQQRISNPGCYATAMQLALAPVLELMAGPAQCFGISGYSGAGTSPSDKNDPEKLRDNVIPYALIGHLHEREATRHLGQAVEFMPHVAQYFRGVAMTVNLHLQRALKMEELVALYRQRYRGEKLVQVTDEVPWVSRIAGRHHAEVGGFTLSEDGHRAVVVATLDNLLKGAATQALQNINLALGLDELTGIPQ